MLTCMHAHSHSAKFLMCNNVLHSLFQHTPLDILNYCVKYLDIPLLPTKQSTLERREETMSSLANFANTNATKSKTM